MSAPVFDPAEVSRALAVLHPRGHVFEVRVPGARLVRFNGRPDPRPGTAFGFFDSGEAALAALPVLEGAEWPALYVSLNPVTPALLARASNRIKAADRKSASTSDRDVKRRTALLIDVDPVRPADISSTDEEHAAALELATRIREFLAGLGWPEPIVADSGNGWHLVPRVDLPAEDGGLVKAFLEALADVFDDERAHVDRTVFNAARIVKLWGSVARKGDSTPDRPHRMSRILSAPAEWAIVTEEMLREATAALRARKPAPEAAAAPRTSSFDIRAFIGRHFPNAEERSWSSGTRWILDPCPFNESHTGSSAAIMEKTSGVLSFKCQHAGCAGLEWKDLREKYEPKPASVNAGSTPRTVSPAPVAAAETTPTSNAVELEQPDALTIPELLTRTFPPREMLLPPFLPSKSITQTYGVRGIGKSRFIHACGLSIGCGVEIIPGWLPPRRAHVLLIDGELPGVELQRRFASLVAAYGVEPEDYFRVVVADDLPHGLPSLTSPPGQRILEDLLGPAELLILDNVSTLLPSVDENDAAAWQPAQDLFLFLRRRGVSTCFLHHSNKMGAQRGTSRREDVLDTVIALRTPEDADESDGSRFTVAFEKHRGFHGKDALPFVLELDGNRWRRSSPEETRLAIVGRLVADGRSVRAIAEETGIPKSTIHRLAARAKGGRA